jgi:glycosyltransferase involved in cell wall biosynthesis
MEGIGSLFDAMTMLLVPVPPRAGGIPLPRHAQVVPLRLPTGSDARRKLSVLTHMPGYLTTMVRHARACDVVHTPLPGDIPLLGMLVALLLRKHLLVRYGGSWVATSQTTAMNRVTRWCMRTFAGGRNVMLATGDGVEPPAPGVHWIFSTALSAERLRQIEPVFERGLNTPPRLIFAGRLSPEKGLAHLIEAVQQMKSIGHHPLPSITLAGDGPQRARLQELVRAAGCEEQFTFAGQLDQQQLSQHFHQADVCIQPSLTEGFSKAWLDAMAHGLPVIASDVGAASAVLGSSGERGWLVSPGDPAALVAIMRQVMTDTIDWPALRRRCRAYVEGRTLEAWARQIGDICAQQWNGSLKDGKLCV